MIDLTKIKYRLTVITETGNQYNIKEFVTGLGWEENENEISSRISFSAKNDKTSAGVLSSIIKPGCVVGIFAESGGAGGEEVARGNVTSWEPKEQSSGNTLKCTCYDCLYAMQQSQDNRFFPEGTGTQAAVTSLLDDFEIPYQEYKGPNVAHGKLKFNNSHVSDIILDLLDDAVKKGAEKHIIRQTEGYAEIVPRGGNTDVYVFRVDNTKSFGTTISTADLVTRVRVIGQSDDNGNASVEATLNGLTDYGIRQRIYVRGSDESLADAQSAAQSLIDENGTLQENITLTSPDVPYIRKGDLVYILSGLADSYYYVKGIQHDCASYSMTMQLEIAKTETIQEENVVSEKREYKEGDIVNFHGGTHYVSSYPDAKGYAASAGPAKINKMNGSGKAHPWSLIHTDSTSNVYGWVDDGTFD